MTLYEIQKRVNARTATRAEWHRLRRAKHLLAPRITIYVDGQQWLKWMIKDRDVKQTFYSRIGSIHGGPHTDHVQVASYLPGGWLPKGWSYTSTVGWKWWGWIKRGRARLG